MHASEDRTGFLDEETRLEVALACREAPLTHPQIAKKLDRDPGGLTATQTMFRRGALIDAGRAHARGSRPGGPLTRRAGGEGDGVGNPAQR